MPNSMDEPIKKRVDESWKEQAEREKREGGAGPSAAGTAGARGESVESAREAEGPAEARFDLFVSSLAVEALAAIGDIPNPRTRKQETNLPHARYLIDLLGVLAAKTSGNLTVDEDKLLKDAHYQLRMRYLGKAG